MSVGGCVNAPPHTGKQQGPWASPTHLHTLSGKHAHPPTRHRLRRAGFGNKHFPPPLRQRSGIRSPQRGGDQTTPAIHAETRCVSWLLGESTWRRLRSNGTAVQAIQRIHRRAYTPRTVARALIVRRRLLRSVVGLRKVKALHLPCPRYKFLISSRHHIRQVCGRRQTGHVPPVFPHTRVCTSKGGVSTETHGTRAAVESVLHFSDIWIAKGLCGLPVRHASISVQCA